MSAERSPRLLVQRIVSGGQTGVDRAALDVALATGLDCGGWCPRGRRAEDGRIPERYPLAETDSASYRSRTKQNVRDSDGTLILAVGPLTGGSRLTQRIALELAKPVLAVDLSDPPTAAAVRKWLAEHTIRVLNVAGPRASQQKTARQLAETVLKRVLKNGRGSRKRTSRAE